MVLVAPMAPKRMDELAGQAWRARRGCAVPAGRGPIARTDLRQRQVAGGERPGEPGDAAQVGPRGREDVDPAVRVVDPVDRNLVDPRPGAFGQHQQFGVEEPPVVLDQRQQFAGHIRANRLEAALGVGEPGGQGASQDLVVATGNDLPLGAADHPGNRGATGCRWPGRSGRRSAGRAAAAGRPGRWTGRRPCRPAPRRRRRSTRRAARDHGPFPPGAHCARRAIRRPAIGPPPRWRRRWRCPLMVMRKVYGNAADSRWCRRRTHGPRSCSSLYTGMTTSTTGAVVRLARAPWEWRVG